MIRSRRTSKICNICYREVAFKDIFRFRTVARYVTLPMDFISLLHHTDRGEVHICSECWERMQDVVKINLEVGELLRD